MRYLIFFLLLISFSKANAQIAIAHPDCGTWEPKPIYYTEWETIDTIKGGNPESKWRKWAYSGEERFSNFINRQLFNPCGSGDDIKWIQFRICRITGIRQHRYKVQSYKYIPKPKSEYELVIDSLIKKQ